MPAQHRGSAETGKDQLLRYRAKIQAIDLVVNHLFTNAQTRYFRVRQEPFFCRWNLE